MSNTRRGHRDREYVQGLMLRNAVWKDLYASGLSLRAIADRYGVTSGTVCQALRHKVMPEKIPRLISQLREAVDNLGNRTEYASDLILLNMKEEDAELTLSPELMEYRKRLQDEKAKES